jgi:hypothetical protein
MCAYKELCSTATHQILPSVSPLCGLKLLASAVLEMFSENEIFRNMRGVGEVEPKKA